MRTRCIESIPPATPPPKEETWTPRELPHLHGTFYLQDYLSPFLAPAKVGGGGARAQTVTHIN
jgi:hypothetical protein